MAVNRIDGKGEITVAYRDPQILVPIWILKYGMKNICSRPSRGCICRHDRFLTLSSWKRKDITIFQFISIHSKAIGIGMTAINACRRLHDHKFMHGNPLCISLLLNDTVEVLVYTEKKIHYMYQAAMVFCAFPKDVAICFGEWFRLCVVLERTRHQMIPI